MTKLIIFDLDDTLYKEIDYLKSAYHYISNYLKYRYNINDPYDKMIQWYNNGDNVFNELIKYYNLNIKIDNLLKLYREHYPNIQLTSSTLHLLKLLKLNPSIIIGLISDGRSITQRNKIKALGLSKYIKNDNIVISEEFGSSKPCLENYKYFMNKYSDASFLYIGNDIKKDFIAPNILGWNTICISDNGRNTHKQDFSLNKGLQPNIIVDELSDILKFI